MRHSDISLTMNVYTDPRQLQVREAVESLPVFVKTEEQVTIKNEPIESKLLPYMLPNGSCIEQFEDDSSKFSEKGSAVEEQEKPREKQCFPGQRPIGLIGFEPTTSTPPELPFEISRTF